MLFADTCDGAGQILAAAVKGVNNGLHSRAAPLLRLLLQHDLLTPVHLNLQQAQQASAHTSEQVQATAAGVTRIALAQLLDHLRRGKGQVLWECVLSEAHARLETCLSPGTCLRVCANASCFKWSARHQFLVLLFSHLKMLSLKSRAEVDIVSIHSFE